MWEKEFSEKGNRKGIIDRFLFHGGLTVSDIVKNSGLSWPTVRKHIKKLVLEGLITKQTSVLEEHYKVTPKFWPKKEDFDNNFIRYH